MSKKQTVNLSLGVILRPGPPGRRIDSLWTPGAVEID